LGFEARSDGKAMAAMIPMMAMTVNSSRSVKGPGSAWSVERDAWSVSVERDA